MNGYMGKLLFVDLTEGKLWEEELTEEMAKDFVGGYGLGAKILFERMKPGVDPLGPDNILGLVTGPATGTGAFFGGRYMAVCKSPVTDGWNDANSGGYFGPELRKAGFDGVFFLGASEKPVYLWINDGEYELRDASELWGLDVKETWEKLKELTGQEKVRAAVIGPAGENLSLFAAVMNDGHRAAGRGGAGAVMGSKKLKAVACYGTQKVEVGDRAALNAVNKFIIDRMRDPECPTHTTSRGFAAAGTNFGTTASAMSGDSPVMNWAGNSPEHFPEEMAHAFDPERFEDKYNTGAYGCAFCPLRCGASYKIEDGRWPLEETERPEYETMSAFGSNCLCTDIEAICKCNEICNRGGFDTITAGSVMAWVMECYEKGILTKEDLDGIEAPWGDGAAMVALMEKMMADEGCGKKLKLGQVGAADAFGKGHECLAVAGGIEPGMHDARLPGKFALIRAFQYDPTPGRHVKGRGFYDNVNFDEEAGKADVAGAANTDMTNSAGLCSFINLSAPGFSLPDMLGAIWGRPVTREDLIKDGTRIFMVRHAFGLREGRLRDKAYISPRLKGEPAITAGGNKDVVLNNEAMGDAFFKALGCDVATGIPSREALEALGGLDAVIDCFYGK